MPSYFRGMFSGPTSNSNPKTHKRSSSAPSPPNPNYIYAAPGAPSLTSSSGTRRDTNNNYVSRANIPSPLRYGTYDSGPPRPSRPSDCPQPTLFKQPNQSQQNIPDQKPARVHIFRSSSNIPGDRQPTPYPIYSHSSFGSVNSTSSSSIYPGSSISAHRPLPPSREGSSGSVTQLEPRPALKQHNSGYGNGSAKSGPQPHVSFMNPNRPTSLNMHPLFAYSRLHRPPISYDVTFTPSSRTVIDRSTHSAIPAHTLSQPATDPPTLNKLVLTSSKLPWPIVVSASAAKPSPRFYLAGSSGNKNASAVVTNLDVLYAVHNTLSTRVTQQEWESLGHGSRAQRKITRAYEKRCIKMGGGWDAGVRRIDYLGEKTRLVGVEVDKSTNCGTGKLVFGST